MSPESILERLKEFEGKTPVVASGLDAETHKFYLIAKMTMQDFVVEGDESKEAYMERLRCMAAVSLAVLEDTINFCFKYTDVHVQELFNSIVEIAVKNINTMLIDERK